MAQRIQRLRWLRVFEGSGVPHVRRRPEPLWRGQPPLPLHDEAQQILFQSSVECQVPPQELPPPIPLQGPPTFPSHLQPLRTCESFFSATSAVAGSLVGRTPSGGGGEAWPMGHSVMGGLEHWRSFSKKGKQAKGRHSRDDSEGEEDQDEDVRPSKKGQAKKGADKGAKGAKAKHREGAGEVSDEEVAQVVLREVQLGIDGLKDSFKKELAKLRTGRATPDMLDHVLVEAYQSHVPLAHVASVTVRDPQCLSVTLHDSSLAGAALKGLQDSPMALNPTVEGGGKGGQGSHILVPVPRLTTETRQAMVKLASQSCETAKVAVRRVRKEGLDGIRGADIAEDEEKRLEKKVEALVGAAIKELDTVRAAKEKEISGAS